METISKRIIAQVACPCGRSITKVLGYLVTITSVNIPEGTQLHVASFTVLKKKTPFEEVTGYKVFNLYAPDSPLLFPD